MKFPVMCIRDMKLESYNMPFFAVSIGQAIRNFGDEIGRDAPDNTMFKHPEDFDLYVLGDWFPDDGHFELGDPRRVARGKEFKHVE